MKVLLDTEDVYDIVGEFFYESGICDKLEKYILWKKNIPECVCFSKEELDRIDDDIYGWVSEAMIEELKKAMEKRDRCKVVSRECRE